MKFGQICLTFLLSVFLFAPSAWSARVKAVKDKKVLIDMESDNLYVGDILKLQDGGSGKTLGLVKIQKVKGKMAQGILKGKAQVGYTAKIRPKKSSSSSSDSGDSSSSASSGNSHWGFLAGINSTSADIKTASAVNVSLKGNGFSFLGFYDFPLMSALSIRGMAGIEQFKVAGSNVCGTGTAACTATINYLALDAWARYIIMDGSFKPWVGGGFHLLFPATKSATALNESSITNTSVFAFGGGFDIAVGTNAMIPIQIEYDLYPTSDSVKASAIAVRGGYGFGF